MPCPTSSFQKSDLSMRVLIVGARGQVGYELMQRVPEGFDAVGMGSLELDITEAGQVVAIINQVKPQLIINAAAYTAVDKAESEPQQAWAVNCEGVAYLALVAERLGIPLFHISTDYVFAGDARTPYRETDPVGPSGVYGASKLGGEVALAANCSQHLIVRTSWVFGGEGSNFVKTMLRLGRERDELGVVADQHGCPTSSASIARVLWALAVRYRERGTLEWGLYHFSGTTACTWYEFAQEIFRQAHEIGLLEAIPSVRPIHTIDFPTPAKRPSWSVLDCNKLYSTHDIAQSDWRVDLAAVLRALV